jgi:hypothetical protein
MSRRNPTKRQRKIIYDLMRSGLTYGEAAMNLPESKSDPKCGGKRINPSETNTPKIKKTIIIYHGEEKAKAGAI